MEQEEMKILIETEQRSKSNSHRINSLEEKIENIREITYSIKEIVAEIKAIRVDMNKTIDRVDTLEKEPYLKYKNRKDEVISQILHFIAGIICMFIAIKLGLDKYI